MKFRKKPVEIDAVQFTPESDESVFGLIDWLGRHDADFSLHVNADGDYAELAIGTLEDGGEFFHATHVASPGDWIIRGVQGEFYPCKPDIFEQTYEAA